MSTKVKSAYYDPHEVVNGDGRKQGNSPPTDELPLSNLSSQDTAASRRAR